jgi:hypothetical protein
MNLFKMVILGAFGKLRKATIIFVIPVRLSACLVSVRVSVCVSARVSVCVSLCPQRQLCSRRTHFHKI